MAGERIAGTLTITGAESEGDTLLLSGGVALKARQLTAEPAEESFSPLGWLLRLRRQTIEQLNALGEGESAALVAAMLTADTADLPAGLRTALSRRASVTCWRFRGCIFPFCWRYAVNWATCCCGAVKGKPFTADCAVLP